MASPDSPAPESGSKLGVLCIVLGTLAGAVALIGGLVVGERNTVEGWIVFGGWSAGALILCIAGTALQFLASIAATSGRAATAAEQVAAIATRAEQRVQPITTR